MPRVNMSATKASADKRIVNYRHIDGTRHDAIVTGGSGTSLNLRVPHLPVASRLKTAIAKRTTRAQTNVWW